MSDAIKNMFKKKVKAQPSSKKPYMTVAELMEKLNEADPEAVVLLSVNGGREGMFEDLEIGLPNRRRMVRLWGDRYNTREVNLAYTCNDDRYGGPAFNIEVGEESP